MSKQTLALLHTVFFFGLLQLMLYLNLERHSVAEEFLGCSFRQGCFAASVTGRLHNVYEIMKKEDDLQILQLYHKVWGLHLKVRSVPGNQPI